MDERTTQELIETLGDDVERCHEGLVQSIDDGKVDSDGCVEADYEFHARQLVRSIMAYIEGVTFSVKVSAAAKCLDRCIEISDHERYMAIEVDCDLNDKGRVIERPARIHLPGNIRFAFSLLERSERINPKFDPSEEWWSALRDTIRTRNRLTHPQLPGDLDVSGDEIVKALRAKQGFDDVLLEYVGTEEHDVQR